MRILVLDCETGGFSPERNPLMSIGLVVADGDKVVDALQVRFSIPENTWLEVPEHADQLKGKFSKKIEYWLNLTTNEKKTPVDEKPARFITAVAAEVNGFVKASETIPGWDMTHTRLWGAQTYESGAKTIMNFVDQHKPERLVGHNQPFDEGFVRMWIPEVLDVLPKDVYDTQEHYKMKFLGGKTKGSALGAICKIAGYEQPADQTFHTEMGDCYATLFIYNWLRNHA